MNARSVKNKLAVFNYYICDIKPELVAVIETWFNGKDTDLKTDCTPGSYRLSDCHRTDSRARGIALLYKETLPVEKVSSEILSSFELSEWTIRPRRSSPLKLIIVYRPPLIYTLMTL